jgi:hypothetical protein
LKRHLRLFKRLLNRRRELKGMKKKLQGKETATSQGSGRKRRRRRRPVSKWRSHHFLHVSAENEKKSLSGE